MAIKYSLNYSQNFDSKKRSSKDIRFVVFHYTGMKNENEAISRLKNFKYKVSAHYFIKISGEIVQLVPERYIAWHAGKSRWKNFKMINKNSIGIEISNPGHKFKYRKYNFKQIKSLVDLSKYLRKKYKIKSNCFLGHSDVAPDRKIDPGEKFPWEYLSKKNIGIWHDIKKKNLLLLRGKKLSKYEMIIFNKKLHKLGYMKSSKILKNINNYKKKLYKVFQMRFRPEIIDGNIDKECSFILKKLLV
tara:strand:- start:120 stop:854 length:735 start_codon:yes stop_codon:yes gene_type:complete